MKIQIDTTLERDIDLLIIEEFISSHIFARIFLDEIGMGASYTVECAVHSKTDADLGESDIVFILNTNGKRHALHIEDKIDAIAMQNQCGRYYERAEKDKAAGEYDEYSVLIVAPAKYLANNAEAQKYEYRVTYEKLRDYFQAQTDVRSQYKLALIERAINTQKNGYQYEANPGVVLFCDKMREYQKNNYPGLPLFTTAWWGHAKTLLSDAILVYKANKGFCDLQFSNHTPQQLYARVKNNLSPRMTVVQAQKSSSVRIIVSPVWMEHAFEDNIENVDEALSAFCELYELSKALVE